MLIFEPCPRFLEQMLLLLFFDAFFRSFFFVGWLVFREDCFSDAIWCEVWVDWSCEVICTAFVEKKICLPAILVDKTFALYVLSRISFLTVRCSSMDKQVECVQFYCKDDMSGEFRGSFRHDVLSIRIFYSGKVDHIDLTPSVRETTPCWCDFVPWMVLYFLKAA